MSDIGPLIRLFVSSTFADFKAERDILQSTVFPRLRVLCEAEGCHFQPIDLRWGVSDEAGNEHRTLTICLAEVARCQRLSPDLNFLILLGDRYGSCFLPESIRSDLVTRLTPHLPASDHNRFDQAYAEDLNALPPVFVRRSRRGTAGAKQDDANRKEEPNPDESLRAALANAAQLAGFSEQELLPFVASATHLEIQRGLLEKGCDPAATLCAIRSFTSAPEGRTAAAFGEHDPEGRARLAKLKVAVEQRIGEVRTLRYAVPGEFSVARADQVLNAHDTVLAEQFYLLLEPRVRDALTLRQSAAQTRDSVAKANQQYAEARASVVIGRDDELHTVATYIEGQTPQPLVVTGDSGVGKSTLIARAMEDATRAHSNAVIVARYIGVTPGTSSLADLLSGLRREIARRYHLPEPEPSGEISPLVAAVASELGTLEIARERPLFLFIDALDQLGSKRQRIDWLPPTLTPNVRIVLSMSSERQELADLRARLPLEQVLHLGPLARDEGASALRAWLAEEGRTLTAEQEAVVLNGFASNGEERGGTPLYLRLAFEQAYLWRSFDEAHVLPPTIPALVGAYFAQLEQSGRNGRELVEYAMSDLALAKHGLAEDELLDVLSRSEPVREDWKQLSPHSPLIDARRPLPVILWARLAADLDRYLTEREADGARLVTFYHRQVLQEAERRYLDGAKKATRHAELADYFDEQPFQRDEAGSAGVWNRRKLAELAYQQAEAGVAAHEALVTTLTDARFLEGKLTVEGVSATLDELALVADSEDIATISSAIRAGAIQLAKDPTELQNQINGRVGKLERLHDAPERSIPWLRLRSQSLLPPDPALLHILQGHTGDVIGCALNEDGSLALSAAKDGTMRLWDTATGETLRVMQSEGAGVSTCALSGNGKRALCSSGDNNLHVWDTETGRELTTLQGHSVDVTACALSADGMLALSASKDHTLRLWATESGSIVRVLHGHTGEVTGCALNYDGTRALSIGKQAILASSRDRTIRLWNPVSCDILHTWKFSRLTEVTSSALSADGMRTLLTPSLLGGMVGRVRPRIWQRANGRSVSTLKGFKGMVVSCALSADGHWALTGAGSAVLGVALATWARSSRVTALLGFFGLFRFFDNFEGSTLRLWDTSNGEAVRIFRGHRDAVAFCALNASGTIALSASSAAAEETQLSDPTEHHTLRVWDTTRKESRRELQGHESPVLSCALTNDGKLALTCAMGDKTLRLWDTSTGKMIRILKGHWAEVSSCALSADGKWALSIAKDALICLWDVESGKQVHIWKFPSATEVVGCALSADGQLALSPRLSGLCLWNTATGKIRSRFLPSNLLDISKTHGSNWTKVYNMSGDGRRALIVTKDGKAQFWDTGDSRHLRSLEGSTVNVNAATLNADGRWALTASTDGKLRVWDTSTGQMTHMLESRAGSVLSCALSADGGLALSASYGYIVSLWDLASGGELAHWRHDTQIRCCALSANGQMAIAGDIDGVVHFLEPVGVVKRADTPEADVAAGHN